MKWIKNRFTFYTQYISHLCTKSPAFIWSRGTKCAWVIVDQRCVLTTVDLDSVPGSSSIQKPNLVTALRCLKEMNWSCRLNKRPIVKILDTLENRSCIRTYANSHRHIFPPLPCHWQRDYLCINIEKGWLRCWEWNSLTPPILLWPNYSHCAAYLLKYRVILPTVTAGRIPSLHWRFGSMYCRWEVLFITD